MACLSVLEVIHSLKLVDYLLEPLHNYCICPSMPIGIDYPVIAFDMEEQPLVTHNAA